MSLFSLQDPPKDPDESAPAFSSDDKPEEAAPCDTCGEREATITCHNCDSDYCSECDSKFHRVGKNREHTRGPKGVKQRTRCEIHDEPLKYFCKTDECLVCFDCIQFGDHKGHDHDLLKNAAGIRRDEIAKLSGVLHDFQTTLSILSSKVKETSEEAAFTIRNSEIALETNDFTFCSAYKDLRSSMQSIIHQAEMVSNHPVLGGNSKSRAEQLEEKLEALEKELDEVRALAAEEKRLREEVEAHWQAQAQEERTRREAIENVTIKEKKLRQMDFPSVQLLGASGPKAPQMAGIYDPIDEACCGMQVYQKRGDTDVWLEYNDVAKSWQIKRTVSKGQDLCWAMVLSDPPINPELAEAVWRVYDGAAWVERSTMKLIVARAGVHIRAVTGPRAAEIIGKYDPTDELCGGATVYHKQGGDMWIEYNMTAKSWQVKQGINRGRDLCCAYMRCDPGSAVESCSTPWRITEVAGRVDQATVKVLPASSGATIKEVSENKATSVTAIFDPDGEGAWRLYDGKLFQEQPLVRVLPTAPAIDIRGVTGPKSADMIGVYEPTDELCSGLPVYQKRGDADTWLEYNTAARSWQIKRTNFKGKNKCFAYVLTDGNVPPEQSEGTWKVFDGSNWREQPSIYITRTR